MDDTLVTVREVGPRDGLQSLAQVLATDTIVDIIRGLRRTGLARIEVGSFVGTRAVPQMANTAEVLARLSPASGLSREVLVVNERGAVQAVDAGADVLVAVVAASDAFSLANARMSTDDALEQARLIADAARSAGTRVSACIATAFACAYSGRTPVEQVTGVAAQLAEMGISEIVLADTTGAAAPSEVPKVVGAVRDAVAKHVVLGLHFHDTRGLALANVHAGLRAGVRLFDSSFGGLGGCPFSPGATGNVATEDLVHLLEIEGFETQIDLDALIEQARQVEGILGLVLPGHVLRAGPRWRLKAAT